MEEVMGDNARLRGSCREEKGKRFPKVSGPRGARYVSLGQELVWIKSLTERFGTVKKDVMTNL